MSEDVIQRAVEVIQRHPRKTARESAQALYDDGLLAEAKPTVDERLKRLRIMAHEDETWRLRGEFIDALARNAANGIFTIVPIDSADDLVAHLDGGDE